MVKTKTNLVNYAFIDSQNLNLGVRSLGWRLDWRKFRQYLRNKYNVTKAFTFIGYKVGLESKGKLLHILTPNKHYSQLLKPFSRFIFRIDLLRDNLKLKKSTGIGGRSKP
ncbi:MAG: hypothetical protein AAB954_02075 [Patescibacteria group bacterium]